YPRNCSLPIAGKVIFAGGMSAAYEDKPRNVLGGKVLPQEVLKIMLRGGTQGREYISLEENMQKIKIVLRRAGYIQLSGIEHIESKENESLQLAVTFKTTN
ncbi:MAG: hypothetical protein FWC82_04305, partial [Firmicutes bacterium]|nr:hypothetical protein [Bacillota bacterium]